MIRIAITGGIACGKSLAGEILERAEWGVCDTDQIAHQLYAPGGEAYEAVCNLAGSDVIREDGIIDRSRLGAKVFSNPNQLAALNQILHPLVSQKVHAWLLDCEKQEYTGAAVIVPLLFEAGLETAWDVDAILCIGCKPTIQRQRLLERGLDDDAIQQRISSQWSIEEKMKASDFGIWNDGSPEDLEMCLFDIIKKVSERKVTWENQ